MLRAAEIDSARDCRVPSKRNSRRRSQRMALQPAGGCQRDLSLTHPKIVRIARTLTV